MSTALDLFNKAVVPSHVQKFLETESNISDRATVPSLTFEGKVWTIALNGEKTKLVKKDEDGDETPISTMRVVILDYAKRRGRAYYEGSYDPAKPGTPLCWSDDGIAPHANVEAPQSKKCEGCPMSVKGSKVSDNGKAVTACSQHRMVVVVPANRLDFTPLRMKIAITSDWDKQNPDQEAQGWFAFQNYTDFLRSKGVTHTAALVTKMKFDTGAAYPKILFSPDRWLEAAEVAKIAPVSKSDEVQGLLGGTWTPAGADGVKTIAGTASVVDEDEAPAPKPAPKAAPKAEAPARKAKPKDDDDDGDVVLPVAKKAAAPIDPDDADIEVPVKKAAPKAAPKAEAKPAAVAADVPDDINSLLEEWGDD
jgi:hypothetical protein